MTVAAIVAVAGDAVVLDAVEAQLAGRYARDYRIECLGDPDDAVALLETLAADGVEADALFVPIGSRRRTHWLTQELAEEQRPVATAR